MLGAFRDLPLQRGAREALGALVDAGVKVAALTNSGADQAKGLLERSRVLGSFTEVISVDEVGRFKSDPAPYRHALGRLGVAARQAAFVAAHAWDVVGAASVGQTAIWVASHERTWPLPVRAGVEVADLEAAVRFLFEGEALD